MLLEATIESVIRNVVARRALFVAYAQALFARELSEVSQLAHKSISFLCPSARQRGNSFSE